MSVDHEDWWQNHLLAVYGGLIGEITPNIRAVFAVLEPKHVHVAAIFDGKIPEVHRENISCVATEILAHLPDDVEVTWDCVRVDIPGRLDSTPGICVYARNEDHV